MLMLLIVVIIIITTNSSICHISGIHIVDRELGLGTLGQPVRGSSFQALTKPSALQTARARGCT